MNKIDNHIKQATELLRMIVSIPSFSFEEEKRSLFIYDYLKKNGAEAKRIYNNILSFSPLMDESKPTLMLNSHIDTVKPSEAYTFNPFDPPIFEDKIYGLGSNDAGASVVSMIQTYLYFIHNIELLKSLPVNLALVLTAEEECSGKNGIEAIESDLRKLIDFAIIGEPTQMNAAIAERGLLVIDATSRGISGHAAINEGKNAIYIAIEDIEVLRNFKFEKTSKLMGNIKMTVTQIEAGCQHNVIPDTCKYVVDIRPTDSYNNKEIMEILSKELKSELKPRSLTNKSSITPMGHPLIKTINSLELKSYISPTTSDWMRITFPAIKMGPGESIRSHKADEYIYTKEIAHSIETYIKFVKNIKL